MTIGSMPFFFLLWPLTLGFQPPEGADLQRYEYSEPHMGTEFRMVLYAPSKDKADRAARAGFDRVERLNKLFSDYDEESELFRLCRRAGNGPVDVSPELADILRKSLLWSERSHGAFDVSAAPLVSLWRKARRTRELPKAEALSEARALVDYRKITVEPNANRVELRLPKTRLDLGGIGKGYAADQVQSTLKAHGITRALVAAGGDICVSQRPPGKEGWIVTIAPLEKINAGFPARLVLENQAVSTSGDLEQFALIQGVRYSHILDPKTGMGLVGRRSATVVAPCATDSDAAAKPVCIFGPEAGPRWIDRFPGLSCLYLDKDENGQVQQHPSKEWSKLRFAQGER
jgi:thiamine biosynthesis lipoprotein